MFPGESFRSQGFDREALRNRRQQGQDPIRRPFSTGGDEGDRGTEARENGMGISLFRRLSEAHPQAISMLQNQYRMCRGIMELSNALIYGDRLYCGSAEVANATLVLTTSTSKSPWLRKVLEPTRTVVFINTDMLRAFEARDQNAINNPVEASIIAEIVEELVNNGVDSKDIGIITPYNSQASLIQHAMPTASVEIHTIDKYQAESAIGALNCSGVVLSTLPIRVSPSKTPVRPHYPLAESK